MTLRKLFLLLSAAITAMLLAIGGVTLGALGAFNAVTQAEQHRRDQRGEHPAHIVRAAAQRAHHREQLPQVHRIGSLGTRGHVDQLALQARVAEGHRIAAIGQRIAAEGHAVVAIRTRTRPDGGGVLAGGEGAFVADVHHAIAGDVDAGTQRTVAIAVEPAAEGYAAVAGGGG